MNRVVHFEIHARNLDKVARFYKSVFGWKIKDMGPKMGNYRLITTGEDAPREKRPGINGGLTPRNGNPPDGSEAIDAFVCTISVDDIDKYIRRVLRAGGTESLAKMDVPGVGWLAYYKDVEGNIFGMLEPRAMKARRKAKK